MIRTPHLKLIAGHSVRHGVRGGAGIIAILFTLVVGLAMAQVVIGPLEMMDQTADQLQLTGADAAQFKAEAARQTIMVARKAIDFAISPTSDQLQFLTRDKPAIVSAILVLLFLVTPLLSCMGGFNQTAGDIGTKGLRFLLIRTERPNIFFGRFIGTYIFSALVFALLFVVLAIYMAIKVKVHPAGDMMLWLAGGYVRLLIFSLPYVALCALMSCMLDSAFGSLMLSLLVVYVAPLLFRIGSGINENVAYAQYLTPWGFKWFLMQPIGPTFFGGVAAMLGFTALFLFLGHKHFSKRDL